MKKQNQTCLPAVRKLSLNKKTISNLTAAEMSGRVGGTDYTVRGCQTWYCTYPTCHGKTCNNRCTF